MPNAAAGSYNLDAGEKVTPVMIYTLSLLGWGDVITREAIKVSVWLRTPMAPQYLTLHNAQVMNVGMSSLGKPQSFREIHVPSSQISAIHLKPPAQEPLDYDPNEPHRKMESTTALVGAFRFDGNVRMSEQTNLERYLDVTKEAFTPLYDVEITQPAVPAMGIIRVPYVLMRRDLVLYSPREA